MGLHTLAVFKQAPQAFEFPLVDAVYEPDLVDTGEIGADEKDGFITFPRVIPLVFLEIGNSVSLLPTETGKAVVSHQVFNDGVVSVNDGWGTEPLTHGMGRSRNLSEQIDQEPLYSTAMPSIGSPVREEVVNLVHGRHLGILGLVGWRVEDQTW